MISITAFFTNQGNPVTNGFPTISIWTTAGVLMVNSASMTNIASNGWYVYNFTTTNGFIQGTSYVYTITGDSYLNSGDRYKYGSVIQDVPDHNYGTVVSGTITTQSIPTTRLEVTGVWVYSLCLFITGALAGQVQKVITFTNNTTYGTLGFTVPFTQAPSVGDQFELINY